MKNLTEQPAKSDSVPKLRHKSDAMRVFFALWPSCQIQQQLHALAKQLQPQYHGRVMRSETLHMTLQFIGNIPRNQLSKIITAADKISALRFTMQFEEIAYWKHNRIAYAKLAGDAPLLDDLVLQLKTALSEGDIAYADQKFSPHITLLRNAEQKPQLQDFPPIAWQVDRFVLVESVLSDQGAHYSIIKEWALK